MAQENYKKIDADFNKLQEEETQLCMEMITNGYNPRHLATARPLYTIPQSEENHKALVANNRIGFCTIAYPEEDHPSGPVRTMLRVVETNPTYTFQDIRFAEQFDDAQWYRARAEYLQNELNKYELEEEEEEEVEEEEVEEEEDK